MSLPYGRDAWLWFESHRRPHGSAVADCVPIQGARLARGSEDAAHAKFARGHRVAIHASPEAPADSIASALVAPERAELDNIVERLVAVPTSTVGPVAEVAEECSDGAIRVSPDPDAVPFDPSWTVRDLISVSQKSWIDPTRRVGDGTGER